MSWGFLGPLRWKTRGGTRITFFGFWLIIPSIALPYLLSDNSKNSAAGEAGSLTKTYGVDARNELDALPEHLPQEKRRD